jgi:hypothetical protein
MKKETKNAIKNATKGVFWSAPGAFRLLVKALKENEIPLVIFEGGMSVVLAITSERLLVATPGSMFSPSSVKQLSYEKISKVVFYRGYFNSTLQIEYPGEKLAVGVDTWVGKLATKALYTKAKELSLEHIAFIQVDTRPIAFERGSFQHFFKNLFRIPST